MYYITDKETREKVYAALAMSDREFCQRLSFGTWQITNGVRSFVVSANSSGAEMVQEAGIIKLDISQQGNSDGSGLVMGCCCSSSCSTEFHNIEKSFNYSGRVLFAECGIKLEDESFFYVPVGYFTIDKPETDDDWRTVSLSAYDDIARMTAKWNSSLAYPSTAKAVLEEIAVKYGIVVEYASGLDAILAARTVTESEAASLTAYTEREVCGFIAGLAGANARMNTVGAMKIDWYASPASSYAVEITADVQWQNGFKKTTEEPFEISAVTSGIDDKVFTAGTGEGISFANPIITESEIAAVYALYKGKTFQPCDCEWRGNPCVECGDIVTVTDKNGVSYTVYVANQEIDLTGGLSMIISCPGGDAEISFDTVNERTRAALNRQKTDLQQAIIKATNAINGQNGGFLEINDTDGDGNPDEQLIKQEESGTTGIIRINAAGIGLSEDGGTTYRTAITFKGMNADEIVTGVLHADRIPNVTADKLSVGEGELPELFYNGDFSKSTTSVPGWDGYNTIFRRHTAGVEAIYIEDSKNLIADDSSEFFSISDWKGTSCTITKPYEDVDFIRITPASTDTYSMITIPVYLENGKRYSISAQINPYNWASTNSDYTNSCMGYFCDDGYLHYFPQMSDFSTPITGESNVEWVFIYEGETGTKNVGLFFRGMLNSSGGAANINVAWVAANETARDTGFYTSRQEWLLEDYKTSRLVNGGETITFANEYISFFSDGGEETQIMFQKKYLENGKRYSLVAQMQVLEFSSLGENACFGIWGQNSEAEVYSPEQLNLEGINSSKIIVKFVFDYTGETGFNDLGITWEGLKKASGKPCEVFFFWYQLYQDDTDEPGFYASNADWLNIGYKTTNLLSATDTTYNIKPALAVENNNLYFYGEVKSQSGTIGCLKYSPDGLAVENASYYYFDASQPDLSDQAIYKSTISVITPEGVRDLMGFVDEGGSLYVNELIDYMSAKMVFELNSEDDTGLTENYKATITPYGFKVEGNEGDYLLLMPGGIGFNNLDKLSLAQIRYLIKNTPES